MAIFKSYELTSPGWESIKHWEMFWWDLSSVPFFRSLQQLWRSQASESHDCWSFSSSTNCPKLRVNRQTNRVDQAFLLIHGNLLFFVHSSLKRDSTGHGDPIPAQSSDRRTSGLCGTWHNVDAREQCAFCDRGHGKTCKSFTCTHMKSCVQRYYVCLSGSVYRDYLIFEAPEVCIYISLSLSIYIYMYICMCVYRYMHAWNNSWTHMTSINVYLCLSTCICKYIYIHINAHKELCKLQRWQPINNYINITIYIYMYRSCILDGFNPWP